MMPAIQLREVKRFFILIACAVIGLTSCKSTHVSKDDSYQQDNYSSRKNKAISDLDQIITDSGIHWKVKTRMLDQIKEQFFEEDQLTELIEEADKQIKKERELAYAKEEEGYFADLKSSPSNPGRPTPNPNRPFSGIKREGLEGQFDAIANAVDQFEARDLEIETLTLFANPDVPVLLIISKEGGEIEYDKPITIKKYLEYLRDTKSSGHRVSAMEKDSSGKISAIELSNY